MGIRRHPKADYAGVIHVDNNTFDLEDLVVTGQRILPGFECRMAHSGMDQIHFTGTAAVVLKSCNFSRIGGPQEDRTVASCPTGIVGRVAEILHTVLRELSFLPGDDVADPQVEITNECGTLAVGRENAVGNPIPVGRSAFRALGVALPSAVAYVKRDRAVTIFESKLSEGKRERFVVCANCRRQRSRKLRLVECRHSCSSRGIDQHEFGSPLRGQAIPKAIVR